MWLTALKILGAWCAVATVLGLVLASAIGDAKAENARHYITKED